MFVEKGKRNPPTGDIISSLWSFETFRVTVISLAAVLNNMEYQNSPNGTDRRHIKDSMFRLQSKDKGALVWSAITELHRRAWRTSSFKSVRPQNSNSWKQSVENVIRLVFVIMHKVKTCRASEEHLDVSHISHAKNSYKDMSKQKRFDYLGTILTNESYSILHHGTLFAFVPLQKKDICSKLKQLLSPIVCITVAHPLTSLSVIRWGKNVVIQYVSVQRGSSVMHCDVNTQNKGLLFHRPRRCFYAGEEQSNSWRQNARLLSGAQGFKHDAKWSTATHLYVLITVNSKSSVSWVNSTKLLPLLVNPHSLSFHLNMCSCVL